MSKPWDDVIPREDQAAFRVDVESAVSRPLAAGSRPALIVVDMTMAFVDSAYPTGWSPTGYPATAANRVLLEAARRAEIPVFFTKRRPDQAGWASPAEQGVAKLRSRRASAAKEVSDGDVIVDDLRPIEGEVVIYKGRKPSAFFGTPLSSYLTYHGVDTVIVTGMVTSGCVRATVVDGFQHNYFVIVPHECVADRSQISHKVSLFDLHMKYADVVDLETGLEYVDKVGREKPVTAGQGVE